MSRTLLPDVVRLHPERLERHGHARRELSVALDDAGVVPGALLRRLQRRVIVESLAGVGPIDLGGLVMPRRRYLSPGAAGRARGCETALGHVEALSARDRVGSVSSATIRRLHALVCAHDGAAAGDAGLFRTGTVGFHTTQSAFTPPHAEQCDRLVQAVVTATNDGEVSIEVAAWVAAMLLAVHPFSDANGRTTRVVFHLLNSGCDEAGVDLGSAEVWAVQREAYLAAVKASQSAADGIGAVDPRPFVVFATEASTIGARRVHRRLRMISEVWESPWESISAAARGVEVAVALDATATIDELVDVVDDPECSEIVHELVEHRRLVWDAAGLLRLAADHPIAALDVRMRSTKRPTS